MGSTSELLQENEITLFNKDVLVAYACSYHPNNQYVRLGIDKLKESGMKLYYTRETLEEVKKHLEAHRKASEFLENFPEHAFRVAVETKRPLLEERFRERYISWEAYRKHFMRMLEKSFINVDVAPRDARLVTLEEMIMYGENLLEEMEIEMKKNKT